MTARGRITLSEVAAHAGVSLATASRAINGSSRKVTPDLEARVLASARALDYSVNAQAQAVARGSSRTVALVLGDIADPYFSAIASGVIRAAKRRDLIVTMATTGTDPAEEVATLSALRAQRPRALILAGSRHTAPEDEAGVERELAAFEALGGSAVIVGGSADGFRRIPVAHADGARALARALIDIGYRRFAVLAGDRGLATAVQRATGFVEGAQERGVDIPDDAVLAGEFSRDGGYRTMSELLARDAVPECVFAVTDVMAVGAMAAVRSAGLTPGRDVAVAGFDDIHTLRDVTPALTTVALPLTEIGNRALDLALAADGGTAEPITGSVALRESTPPVRVRR